MIKHPERTKSVIIAAIFFGIFGIFSIIVGVDALLHQPYPYVQRLPMLGHIALMIAILSFIAAGLLWKSKRLGGYVGIVSFMIAYGVNVYVGELPHRHAIAGAIVGLILLIPLVLAWRSLS